MHDSSLRLVRRMPNLAHLVLHISTSSIAILSRLPGGLRSLVLHLVDTCRGGDMSDNPSLERNLVANLEDLRVFTDHESRIATRLGLFAAPFLRNLSISCPRSMLFDEPLVPSLKNTVRIPARHSLRRLEVHVELPMRGPFPNLMHLSIHIVSFNRTLHMHMPRLQELVFWAAYMPSNAPTDLIIPFDPAVPIILPLENLRQVRFRSWRHAVDGVFHFLRRCTAVRTLGLPRALSNSSNVAPIDELFRVLQEHPRAWPSLQTLEVLEFPNDWSIVEEVLRIRNGPLLSLASTESRASRAISSFKLPFEPHPCFLEPLCTAMSGKYSFGSEKHAHHWQSFRADTCKACDQCVRSGWWNSCDWGSRPAAGPRCRWYGKEPDAGFWAYST